MDWPTAFSIVGIFWAVTTILVSFFITTAIVTYARIKYNEGRK